MIATQQTYTSKRQRRTWLAQVRQEGRSNRVKEDPAACDEAKEGRVRAYEAIFAEGMTEADGDVGVHWPCAAYAARTAIPSRSFPVSIFCCAEKGTISQRSYYVKVSTIDEHTVKMGRAIRAYHDHVRTNRLHAEDQHIRISLRGSNNEEHCYSLRHSFLLTNPHSTAPAPL